ncbi:unnamed protein product [Eruca vesicaria subsp. sativa]|uniref:TIR domain-containing protein n=1 Tax=Eruca vesicaria subsp. sativa TaxID=29727 RepID=A0ABC8KVI0_ERUVS|nr:unnamed protein product [Eruca vesicaria subsp. sativa]
MASSLSRSVWKYDAFLSFRGTDVRRNFISHLTDEGIITFHDDTDLERGSSILKGLEEAMNQSRFAVVVISEDYATSQWCLKELSFMVDLTEKKRFDLIPIFYEIPISLCSRAEAVVLAKLLRIMRRDLMLRPSDDSKLTQEVVRDLCDRLYLESEPSDETSEFVGMSLHKKRMESLLTMDSSDSDDDVKMVGVWGMGGRGKTTIAKCVYESLSTHFPSRCYLTNVKDDFQKHGESSSSSSSSSYLRKQIMSEIFPKSPLNARCVSPEAMRRRLRGKKVLLILDDVDDVKQLQELAGDCKWFGPGS